MQSRPAVLVAKGYGQHLWTEARTAHAEKRRILEIPLFDLVGKRDVFGDLAIVDGIKPAEPAILIAIGPQRCVAPPKPPHLAVRAPFVGGFINRFFKVLIEHKCLRIDSLAEDFNSLVRDRAKKLVGGVGKEPYAVANELIGDRLQ